MRALTVTVLAGWLVLAGCASDRPCSAALDGGPVGTISRGEPLAIGDTFTIESAVLGETRRINVFEPSVYGQAIDAPMPTLYVLDGGRDEDLLHIAGLVQILVSNGGMRPFLVVGIENTARRRDMTGPTSNPEDKEIAPVVGGSETFRRFIREELMPVVRERYGTTDEAAIIGESLAGLFVVETLLLEPDLFAWYVAVDPSLWWSDRGLVRSARERVAGSKVSGRAIFLASSNETELAEVTAEFAGALEGSAVACQYVPLPEESHATVLHPAVLMGFRSLFAPAEGAEE